MIISVCDKQGGRNKGVVETEAHPLYMRCCSNTRRLVIMKTQKRSRSTPDLFPHKNKEASVSRLKGEIFCRTDPHDGFVALNELENVLNSSAAGPRGGEMAE